MKRIIVVIAVMIAMTASAQHHERRDTLSLAAWKRAVMRAPVLTGESEPQIIVPHQPSLCFNVEFDLKMTVGSRVVEQCMFINYGMGLTGYLPPSASGLINMIIPEIPDFTFSVISLKGNVYRYFNKKGRNNALEYYVTTANSQTFQYQMQTGGPLNERVTMNRKTETGSYCNGNMTARAYRTDDPNTTWFIYGDRFPEKIHPKRMLGNFGVGYLHTEEGLFIVTEIRTNSFQCRVTDIQNSNACLNTQPFRIMEDEFNTKREQELQREREKLARQEAHISGDCIAEQTALLNFRKEMHRKQEENLRRSKEGNLYQDPAAQRGILGMMDPLMSVQEGILNTRLSICKTQKSMERSGSGGSQRAAERIGCLGQQLSALQQLETQMRALDQQYASEPGRAYAEKSTLYVRNMPRGCN